MLDTSVVQCKGSAADFYLSLTIRLAVDVFSMTFAKVIETFVSAEFFLNTIARGRRMRALF